MSMTPPYLWLLLPLHPLPLHQKTPTFFHIAVKVEGGGGGPAIYGYVCKKYVFYAFSKHPYRVSPFYLKLGLAHWPLRKKLETDTRLFTTLPRRPTNNKNFAKSRELLKCLNEKAWKQLESDDHVISVKIIFPVIIIIFRPTKKWIICWIICPAFACLVYAFFSKEISKLKTDIWSLNRTYLHVVKNISLNTDRVVY